MIKRITLLAMAVAAFAAFAAPGMANAAKLTQPAGTLVTPGTTIVLTSSNTVTHAGGNTLTCAMVTLNATVTKNDGTTVELAMDGANDKAETCEIVGLGPVSIDPTFEGLSATGAGPGTAAFSFNVTGICEAESAGSENVLISAEGPDAQIESEVTGSCGEGNLEGTFSAATTKGVAIIVEQ